MIKIIQLSKNYIVANQSIPALRHIQLDIPKGKIFGIIGRSGAGKSTLLRMLNLLERPDQGQILLEGKDITLYGRQELMLLRHRIGMVFQHFNLLSSKTVAENIALPIQLLGKLDASAQKSRVKELLDLVGLTEHANKYPAQLSGGQKQRVGIARALANSPYLLLCDEATSALDPEATQSILQLLTHINHRLGITIVLITHEMPVIQTICDEVAVMEKGEIIEQGKAAEVLLHPQHAVTQSLIAETYHLRSYDLAQLDSPHHHLWRLTYLGNTSQTSLLSRISIETKIEISVLQGVISQIKGVPYGQLIVSLHADDTQASDIMKRLTSENVRVDRIEPTDSIGSMNRTMQSTHANSKLTSQTKEAA